LIYFFIYNNLNKFRYEKRYKNKIKKEFFPRGFTVTYFSQCRNIHAFLDSATQIRSWLPKHVRQWKFVRGGADNSHYLAVHKVQNFEPLRMPSCVRFTVALRRMKGRQTRASHTHAYAYAMGAYLSAVSLSVFESVLSERSKTAPFWNKLRPYLFDDDILRLSKMERAYAWMCVNNTIYIWSTLNWKSKDNFGFFSSKNTLPRTPITVSD